MKLICGKREIWEVCLRNENPAWSINKTWTSHTKNVHPTKFQQRNKMSHEYVSNIP
jgi:hypothetical protein